MDDPRQAEVWGKKTEVADRTLNERKFCKVCDYYYSEMFTCPICYGAEQERERIIELLEGTDLLKTIESGAFVNYADTAIELIKGEQK